MSALKKILAGATITALIGTPVLWIYLTHWALHGVLEIWRDGSLQGKSRSEIYRLIGEPTFHNDMKGTYWRLDSFPTWELRIGFNGGNNGPDNRAYSGHVRYFYTRDHYWIGPKLWYIDPENLPATTGFFRNPPKAVSIDCWQPKFRLNHRHDNVTLAA